MAIQSFKDEEAEIFFTTGRAPRKKGWACVANIVKRKLDMLEYARELRDLLSPPNNRLESLEGNLMGFYSIRVNDQWRIVFRWNKQPYDVRIMDYH
jgi:proteic killer suppression protein